MNIGNIDIALFLLATTGIIVLLAILIVSFVHFHQKNKYLHTQIVNSLKLEHEHRLMTVQLEIQESTCRSISREIHDNINLSLILVKLNLNTFNWLNKRESSKKIETSIQIVNKVIEELSDISKSLNSEMVEGLGLISAIENEIDRIRATNIFEIQFNTNGNPVYLEKQSELLLFRIIQEALNNIIKHANAKSVELNLEYFDQQVILQIADNGKGFDPISEFNWRCNGLKNMQLRTRLLNGQMNVASKKSKGTTLTFKVPVLLKK